MMKRIRAKFEKIIFKMESGGNVIECHKYAIFFFHEDKLKTENNCHFPL